MLKLYTIAFNGMDENAVEKVVTSHGGKLYSTHKYYVSVKALVEINEKIYDARDEAEKAETALEQYIDDPDNADDKLMYGAENALEKVREAMELLLDATNDIEGYNDEEE